MNSLYRHISPKTESKDASLFVASFLTIVCLLLLLLNASFDVEQGKLSLGQLDSVSDQQKAQFIANIRRQIAKVNRKIKYQQALLDKLNQRLVSQSFHSNSDLIKLRRLYKEYAVDSKITANNFDSDLEELRRRMVPVVPSVVIAMAAMESNWGQSSSALEYKNYFIRTCVTTRCQPTNSASSKLVATSSKKKTPQRYNQIDDSIKALINSLNSHVDFQVFRNTRAGFQRRGKLYTGKQMLGTLKYASIYSDIELEVLETILLENSL